MASTSATWRRTTVAIALGALTFGAALPAAATTSSSDDGAVAASDEAVGVRSASLVRTDTVSRSWERSDSGGITVQGLAWK